jgi:parallel beta-helix repeat protein
MTADNRIAGSPNATARASIKINNAQGTLGNVTGNIVTAPTFEGISCFSPVIVSGNTVTNSGVGIEIQQADADGASVTSNKILSSSTGIELSFTTGVVIKSNTIAKSSVGIEFNCKTGNTVSGNVINDAATGLDMVPLSSTP